MPRSSERDHYADRAAAAIDMAEKATDPVIAAVHERLAASYLELARYAGGERPPLRAFVER